MNMTEWIQKQYVVAGIAAVCLVSMLVKCLIRHKYRAMLREVQDMGHSKHKLVKSMVMKFDACYKLKMGVPNVSLFVKKYLWHYRMMGLYMKTWENINGVLSCNCNGREVWQGRIFAMRQECLRQLFFHSC